MQSTRFSAWRRAHWWASLLLILATLFVSDVAAAARNKNRQPAAAGPDLRVEFLGAEKGFAVGAQSVTILCVIRNTGPAPLPENTARVRCYPLTGLDFMDGQLWPAIPALNSNQAVAFRWRLAVSDQTRPLVFSVLITKAERVVPTISGAAPVGPGPAQPAPDVDVPGRVAVVSIPRFPTPPHLLGTGVAGRTPQASSGRGSARVGNDRSLINVLAAQDRIPVLVLAGKEGADWKVVSIGAPCLQVRSAEEGQTPWWESFRWTNTDVQESRDSATLTLQGTVGDNWNARIVLESRSDTGVIQASIRLTARRILRIYGLQMPRLLAVPPGTGAAVKADGSPEILSADPNPLSDVDQIAAAHTGGLTYGITWPAAPPLLSWRSARLPEGDADHLPVLGGSWAGEERGEVVLAGATIESSFRLFVFGPSDTVRDALRFRIP